MKKWIRWQGLIAFGGFCLVISIAWFLLIDSFIVSVIERYGSEALGAKVEVQRANLSLFPLGLELEELACTNPDEPMKNAVEIGNATMSLDLPSLLVRKVIINTMQMTGVRLNTQRKTSGAIPGKKSPPKKSNDTPGKTFSMPAFDTPDVKEILAREQLDSIKLAETFQKDIKAEQDNWKKRLTELPDENKLKGYETRIKNLKSSSRGLGGILGATKDIQIIQKDLDNDLTRIKDAQTLLDTNLSSYQKRIDAIAKAPAKDFERLKEKYTFSSQGLGNMTNLLIGPKAENYLTKTIFWYEKLSPLLEGGAASNKDRQPENIRGKGVFIHFDENKPLPEFLVRHLQTEIITDSGTFSGKISNITNQQQILGSPLEFNFTGQNLKKIEALTLAGVLDHIDPHSSQDTISLAVTGQKTDTVVLSDNKSLPLAMEQSTANITIRASLQQRNLNAAFDVVLKPVKLTTSESPESGAVIQAFADALSEISKLSIWGSATGTLDDYDIKLSSDLDESMKNVVSKAFTKQAKKFEDELRKAVVAKTSGAIGQSQNELGNFDAISKELTTRLNLGSTLTTGGRF
ncbi:MAG: TIGR03545 family protein [Proteobacteria bacterium]|nr:TIGR03545 family protein [Pseudomonadota bacterium]MBU1708624.1 TIGR03545 family protein [Pseudomonadota bacterium]